MKSDPPDGKGVESDEELAREAAEVLGYVAVRFGMPNALAVADRILAEHLPEEKEFEARVALREVARQAIRRARSPR